MVRLLLALLVVAAGGFALAWFHERGELPSFGVLSAPATATVATAKPERPTVAAPGRVEPLSEEIELAAEIGGKLKAVNVREGESIAAGQVLAELENEALKARVDFAEAQVRQKEAVLRRVLNGARPEERAETQARVRQAEAVARNAKSELDRRTALVGRGFTSTEEAQRLERIYEVAKADLEATQQQHALMTSPPRDEDVASARAEVAIAEAQLAEAKARFEMTLIRAPLSGQVLRVHRQPGETVSDLRDTPIVTVADTSVLRVRAEVDEADISKVRLGQSAYIRADAFGEERFRGKVMHTGASLGRKKTRTDQPGERVDTKVLEILIELEDSRRLLPGLRVDVFLSGDTAGPSS